MTSIKTIRSIVLYTTVFRKGSRMKEGQFSKNGKKNAFLLPPFLLLSAVNICRIIPMLLLLHIHVFMCVLLYLNHISYLYSVFSHVMGRNLLPKVCDSHGGCIAENILVKNGPRCAEHCTGQIVKVVKVRPSKTFVTINN